MNDLLRRSLTSSWFVIFIMGGFWLHPITFFITGLIILIGTHYEYYRIVSNEVIRPQIISGLVVSGLSYALSFFVASGILDNKYLLLIIPALILILISELYRKQEKPFESLAHTFFPFFYITFPFSLFPFSVFSYSGISSIIPTNLAFSPGIVIGFFILTWVNDTGAYLAGISLGRHRLMERISPKKSWEGFIGGLVLAVIISVKLTEWLGIVDRIHWVIISVIIAVVGTYGDLVESMLKRSAGVKDSGRIMPGHGGFLDRFDSTILSFPLVYLFILLFG